MSITLQDALAMNYDQLVAAIKDPTTAGEMQELMRNRELAVHTAQLLQERKTAVEAREAEVNKDLTRPSTAELEAQAKAMAAEGATPTQVNDAVSTQANSVVPAQANAVDHSVEDGTWKEVGITVYRDTTGKVIRASVNYQVFEEDEKTPIGRETHFEAATLFEAFLKMRHAHILATRAYTRLRRQKLTFQQQQKTALSAEQLKAAAVEALKAQDVNKMEEVIVSTIESQYKELDAKQAKTANDIIRSMIQIEFRSRHISDYYNCQANGQAITAYLNANNLEFTLDNLEVAFIDLTEQGKLVPVPRPATKSAETTTNSASTATVTPQPAAASANTPAPASAASAPATVETTAVAQAPTATSTSGNEATATTSAGAANPQQPARRPGVNGSLPPGSGSAPRPVPQDPALARKEFMRQVKNMSAEEMKRKRDTDPQFVKQLAIYGIKLQ